MDRVINKHSNIFVASTCDGHSKQFYKTDADNVSPELLDVQMTSFDVLKLLKEANLIDIILKYEQEIWDEGINRHLVAHGTRHIKNVLFYTALVGQTVIKDEHDFELMMLSAKYHDVARKIDGHEIHAEPSARIMVERLKDKYSPLDIGIIKTCIEFHEVPRDIPEVDQVFLDIAKNNGIPSEMLDKVRTMAEVLKDADALDRTRFVNRARLQPRFLKFDISKRLIKFAAELQETYALRDLKKYHCDEAISVLLQRDTPQELLREIRYEEGIHRDIRRVINVKARACLGDLYNNRKK